MRSFARRVLVAASLAMWLAGCATQPSSSTAPPVPEPSLDTVCTGPSTGRLNVIFLQGMTSEKTSPFPHPGWQLAPEGGPTDKHQQPHFERVLEKLGNEYGIRFAIPYSDTLCRNSDRIYCWGNDQPASVAQTYARVVESARTCFAPGQPWGVIGFSNGGYHVGRLIVQGQEPVPVWAVAAGSAGTLRFRVDNPRSRAVPLFLEIGTLDITRPDTQRFFGELSQAGYAVHYREFYGGHELDEQTLRHILDNVTHLYLKGGDLYDGQ